MWDRAPRGIVPALDRAPGTIPQALILVVCLRQRSFLSKANHGGPGSEDTGDGAEISGGAWRGLVLRKAAPVDRIRRMRMHRTDPVHQFFELVVRFSLRPVRSAKASRKSNHRGAARWLNNKIGRCLVAPIPPRLRRGRKRSKPPDGSPSRRRRYLGLWITCQPGQRREKKSTFAEQNPARPARPRAAPDRLPAREGLMASLDPTPQPSAIATRIWDMKYRFKAAGRDARSIARRGQLAAGGAAAGRSRSRPRATVGRRFYAALEGFRSCPPGRIMAGAGTRRGVTLFNCFVMGTIPDDMEGIFDSLKEAALTMQQGGGIGYDFSTLRPKGAPVQGRRRGCLGAALVHGRVGRDVPHDHVGGQRARRDDGDDALRPSRHRGLHRGQARPGRAAHVQSLGAGDRRLHGGGQGRRPWELDLRRHGLQDASSARELWDKIMRATYDYAEPGVDLHRPHQPREQSRIIARRSARPTRAASSPCRLMARASWARSISRRWSGSVHGGSGSIDEAELAAWSAVAVRLLDNVVDISPFPAAEAAAPEAKAKRRIGLGVTGLADALIMCGVRYGVARKRARSPSAGCTAIAAGGLSRLGRSRAPKRAPSRCSTRRLYLAGETCRRWTTMCARRSPSTASATRF